jgi:hypothetical protein
VAVRLDFSHEFPFSADRYVELFFDAGLVDYLRAELKDMHEYRVEILERTPTRYLRTLKVAPRIELPGKLGAILGRKKRIAWLETTSHAVGTPTLDWNILTSLLTEKIQIGGTYVLEDLGPNLCRRAVLGEINVRYMGVGHLVEDHIAGQMEKSFSMGREHMIAYDAANR